LGIEPYSSYLQDQIERSGLGSKVQLLRETSEIAEAYAQADILLLPSRLVPFPNVAVEALCAGLPVVCSEKAAGTAAVLAELDLAEHCVAPYMDTGAMATLVVRLISDPELRSQISDKLKKATPDLFSFPNYIKRTAALAGLVLNPRTP